MIDELPFDLRRLKKALKDHSIGRLEVKKRGVDIDPHKIAGKLSSSAERAATLFVARKGDSVAAILAQRVPPGEPG